MQKISNCGRSSSGRTWPDEALGIPGQDPLCLTALHTELVPFNVDHNDPARAVRLAEVRDKLGSQAQQSLDFFIPRSVLWLKIQVQPVLDLLALGNGKEQQAWPAALSGAHEYLRDLGPVVLVEDPSQDLCPKGPESVGIGAVELDIAYERSHDVTIGRR